MELSSVRSALICFLLFVLIHNSCSQNAEIDMLNANFDTLRMYSQSINSSLSLECIWYLSPLFGESNLFPPLPSATTLINFDLEEFPVTEDELAEFYQNPGEEDQLSNALDRCENFGENNPPVLLFLYNLLRSYEIEPMIFPQEVWKMLHVRMIISCI